MKKLISLLFISILCVGIAGCTTKQDTGVVTGGAVGALIGSTIGGGSGRAVAIAAGAVTGALIGGAIGRNMDLQDQRELSHALEHSKTNHATSWSNPDTGCSYTVKPTRTYRKSNGHYCREYLTWATINGKRQRMYGTACRQPDGSWKAVR